MRMMETIRQKGSAWLIGFLGFFLVSVFAGLGISGGFSFGGGRGGAAPDENVTTRPTLSPETNAVMTVNGRPIDQNRFNTYVGRVIREASRSMSDPSYLLDIYSFSSLKLIQEEVIAQKGETLGVKVTKMDLAEAKANAIAPFLSDASGPSGNIVGDLTKGLGSARDKKVAFKEYLLRNGVSEQEWKVRVNRELLLNNTMEALQKKADDAALLKAEETKVLVDEALADGVVFQEVAREYSDNESATRGGDIGTWVKRGLLSDEIEDVLYSLEKGETSDWFEVEVGFQKFKVYARKETSDPEFEDKEAEIVEKLKVGKEEDYEPTEEEIAEEYLEIKYYFIQLDKSTPNAANTEITELIEEAVVTVNDPYILAYQALHGDKLQPPADWNLAKLEDMAKDSHYGEGYDFALIADKLAIGNPDFSPAAQTPDEEPSETENEELAGLDDDDEQVEDDGIVESNSPDASELPDLNEQPADYPIYALAIGLLQYALVGHGDDGSAEINYLIANTYIDWLNDEEQSDAQPLERTKAREAVETNLERAVSRYTYSPEVYAKRGLNLAWLDMVDEAKDALSSAEEYAPATSDLVWEKIREGYEILDDQEAMDSIDERVAKWRQEELQAQIERQQAASMQQQQPITINMDDIPLPDDGDDAASETTDDDAADANESEE